MIDARRLDDILRSRAATADLKSRTIRGGAFAMAAEGIEFVLRIASLIILARLLVPEYFGLVAMVTAITAVADRFKDLGLSVATIQREDITGAQVSTLFWVNVAVGLGIALAIAALAIPIARFYGEPRLTVICIVLASSFFFSGITIQHQALLRRLLHFDQLAAVQISASAGSVAVAVTLALLDYGYWALVAREVSRAAFLALGTWICMPWIPGRPSRHSGVRSMLLFGGNITAFNLILFFTNNLDQILVGKVFGATPLGLYRQGINMVLAPITQLTFPVNTVAEATLSRLQDAADRYRRYYVRFVGALASITMPVAVFLGVFAAEVVQVVLGAKWIAATDYFRIFAVAALIRPGMSTVGFVLVTCGQSRRYLWFGVIQSGVLAAFLVLGLQWGPKGVAYAHVAASYLLLCPIVVWGFRGTPITAGVFVSAVQKPLLASVAMGVALLLVKEAGFVNGPQYSLLLGCVLAAPLYFGTLALLPGGREALGQAFAYVLSLTRQPTN